jgi:hypothetical protein
MEDTKLIQREAAKLFKQTDLSEGQLELFIKDAGYG